MLDTLVVFAYSVLLRCSEGLSTVTRSTHSYISVNTVPFYSPCAVLLIATLILICQIPLGTYHWKFTSGWRIQCCHLKCYPWPSPPPKLKIASCSGNNSASLSPSVWKALSQWAVVHRPKCVRLPSIKVSGEQAYAWETENNSAHPNSGVTVGMWTSSMETRWQMWFNIDAERLKMDDFGINSYSDWHRA